MMIAKQFTKKMNCHLFEIIKGVPLMNSCLALPGGCQGKQKLNNLSGPFLSLKPKRGANNSAKQIMNTEEKTMPDDEENTSASNASAEAKQEKKSEETADSENTKEEAEGEAADASDEEKAVDEE